MSNHKNILRSNPMETEPILKLIAKFAIPCVISLLVNSLYNIVDQIFIGRGVGYLGNGATNVVFPITVVALAFALLIGDGCASFLSIKLGEKKIDPAARGVGNSIVMLAVVGIIFLVIGLLFLNPIISLFGCTDLIRPYALDYGYIIVIGLPFMIISTGINSVIRADGNPQFAMLSMLVGAILNTILDPIFIFTFGMGVKGAALATIIGQIGSFILSIIYIKKFRSFKFNTSLFKIDFNISRTILGFGVSSFITQISITIVMAVTNNMLTMYGGQSIYGSEIPLTALGIVMKVNQILISILVGIAVGAQPIVGYNYGAKNYKRVQDTFLVSMILATIASAIGFIFFYFTPEFIVKLFGSEDALYMEFAVKCFRIFLLLCIFNGFQTVSGIFFQSLGKPVKSAIISLSRQVVFLVPAAILMPRFIGVEGVLWAGPIADGLAFILSFIFIALEMNHLTKMHKKSFENKIKYTA